MKQGLKGALIGAGITALSWIGYNYIPLIDRAWDLDNKVRYILPDETDKDISYMINGEEVIVRRISWPPNSRLSLRKEDLLMYSESWNYVNPLLIDPSGGSARNLDFINLNGVKLEKRQIEDFPRAQAFYESLIEQVYEFKMKQDGDKRRESNKRLSESLKSVNEQLKTKIGK